jgi:hypothetical protein
MFTGLRRHMTPANAIALAALLIALGGTGVAATTLANGSVTTAKLADKSVSTAKLANASVKAAKLANGSVSATKLANNSVSTAKLAASAVTSAKVAAGTLDATDFKPGVLGGLSSSKVSIVTGTPVNVPAGSAGTTATATCPAGQRAIAGGFNVGQFAFSDATGPTADGTGWSVTAGSAGPATSITATVVCAAP